MLLFSLFLIVVGTIVGGLGVRAAAKPSDFSAAPGGRLATRASATGEELSDKDKEARRIIGRMLMFLGLITIACGIYRLIGVLLWSY